MHSRRRTGRTDRSLHRAKIARARRAALAATPDRQEQQLSGGDLFRLAFNQAGVPAALLNLDRRIVAANDALCSLLGYDVGQLVGTRLRRITHAADTNVDRTRFRQLLDGSRREFVVEKRYVRADRHELRAESVVALLRDTAGNPAYYTLQLHDITDRHASEESLRAFAMTDELTGLYNRRGFKQLAEHELRGAARNGGIVIVLYIDVDGFKEINDRYGHATGDQALQTVARLLRGTFRECDLLGRQGGDEFVALLRCGYDENEQTVIARLRQRVDWYNATRALPFPLRLSVGAVLADAGDHRSIDELLSAADDLLYDAKRHATRQRS